MIERLRARQEWQFFAALPRADARLTAAWWILLVLSGALPAVFAVATGGRSARSRPPTGSAPALAFVGVVFVLMLVVGPILTAVSMNLGNLLSAWLNERLINSCVDPPGIGHLEDPELADDLTTSREFDRGMTGPPMYLNLDFIASSLVGTWAGWPRPSCWPASPGGRPSCWCWPGRRRTGCCGRAESGRTATPRRSARPSGTPTTRTGSPSIRNRPRNCDCSGWPAGPWPASSSDGGCSSSCSSGRPGCGRSRWRCAWSSWCSRTRPSSVLSGTRSSRARCRWTGSWCSRRSPSASA